MGEGVSGEGEVLQAAQGGCGGEGSWQEMGGEDGYVEGEVGIDGGVVGAEGDGVAGGGKVTECVRQRYLHQYRQQQMLWKGLENLQHNEESTGIGRRRCRLCSVYASVGIQWSGGSEEAMLAAFWLRPGPRCAGQSALASAVRIILGCRMSQLCLSDAK